MSNDHDDDERFVLAFDAPTITEGEIAKGRLEAEGIQVMVKGEGEDPFRVGTMQLWVPEDRLADAQSLLDAATAGDLEVEEADEAGQTDE